MSSSKTGTHALGMVVTQYIAPNSTSSEIEHATIPRVDQVCQMFLNHMGCLPTDKKD